MNKELSGSALIEKALEIAFAIHHGQRDLGGKPYIWHCLCVALRSSYLGDNAKAAGILHDVIEDSGGRVTLQALTDQGFPPLVVHTVDLLTRKSHETYTEYIERIAAANNDIPIYIKIADLRENLREDRGVPQEEFDQRKERYTLAIDRLLRILAVGRNNFI